MTPIEKAVMRSKVSVLANPKLKFFAGVLFSLNWRITEEVPTAATNGKNLLINPNFFESLGPSERDFLLMHETFHVVLQHMLRLAGRDMRRWNAACDYAINAELIKIGMTMPAGGLYEHKYAGLSADEIYNDLPDDAKPDHEDLIEAPNAKDAKDISQAITKAAIRAQNQTKGGTDAYIPSEVRRMVEKATNPKLPWFTLLRKYLNGTMKGDFTLSRPNRRFLPTILPSRHSEKLEQITVVIDVSGSVSKQQFQHFVNEAYGIMSKMKPSKMTLIQFSSGLVGVDQVRTKTDFDKVEFNGGGGTRVQPVCDWVAEHKPNIVVVFTDGYFYEPKRRDSSNWVWIINENPSYKAPWGRTIHFDPPTD